MTHGKLKGSKELRTRLRLDNVLEWCYNAVELNETGQDETRQDKKEQDGTSKVRKW